MALSKQCNTEIPQLSEVGRNFFKKSKSLRILITGRTGVGKSTLINSFVGKVVAPEGNRSNPPDPETSKVAPYCHTILDVDIIIYDSPGLQDGIKNEVAYLKDLAENCKNVSLIFYCVKMTDGIISEGEYHAISKLSDAFGKEDFWNHALFVLTFANEVKLPQNVDSAKYFEDQIALWRANLYEVLISERIRIGQEIAKKVPVIPAGYQKNPLPSPKFEYWLTNLFNKCLERMEEIAMPALLKINWKRLQTSQEVDISQHKQPLVYNEDTLKPFLKSIKPLFYFPSLIRTKLEDVIPMLRSISLTPESGGENPDTGYIGSVIGCFGSTPRKTAICAPEAMSMHEATSTESQDVGELQEDCATGMREISSQDHIAVGNSAGSTETPSLDDRPTLKLLRCLKTADEKQKLDIVQRIGHEWYEVGIQLNFDDYGTELNKIKDAEKSSDPNRCCTAMFQYWLKGNGVEPCSWRKLIEIFKDCNLIRLAEDVQDSVLNS